MTLTNGLAMSRAVSMIVVIITVIIVLSTILVWMKKIFTLGITVFQHI